MDNMEDDDEDDMEDDDEEPYLITAEATASPPELPIRTPDAGESCSR